MRPKIRPALPLVILLCLFLPGMGQTPKDGAEGHATPDIEPVNKTLTPASVDWTVIPDEQNHQTEGMGTFSATITIGDGAAVYDITYPQDFNAALGYPKDGGTVQLAARDAATSPTPAEWLGCLHYSNGLSLHGNRKLATVLQDPMICRIRAQGQVQSTAIAGVLWPAKNQQPLDQAYERCGSEAVIWFEHLSHDATRFVLCLIVIDQDAGASDVVVLERQGNRLVSLATSTGKPGTSIALDPGRGRASEAVLRYQMKQRWRADPSARADMLETALQSITAKADKAVRDRSVRFERVELDGDRIRFVFSAVNTRKLNDLIRPGQKPFAIDDHLFNVVRGMICHDALTEALSEFQAEQETFVATVLRESGGLTRHRGALPARNCYNRE